MRRLDLALFVALAVAALAVACEGKAPSDTHGPTVPGAGVGIAAPELAGKTVDGETFSLAELRGSVVLVNVWATWCGPCRQELPELRRLHHAHRDRGFTVVGISVDARRSMGPLRAMIDEYQLDYPMVFDPDQRAVEPLGIRGYPTSILVDRQGVVRWRRDGLVHVEDDELAAAIAAALAGA